MKKWVCALGVFFIHYGVQSQPNQGPSIEVQRMGGIFHFQMEKSPVMREFMNQMNREKAKATGLSEEGFNFFFQNFSRNHAQKIALMYRQQMTEQSLKRVNDFLESDSGVLYTQASAEIGMKTMSLGFLLEVIADTCRSLAAKPDMSALCEGVK